MPVTYISLEKSSTDIRKYLLFPGDLGSSGPHISLRINCNNTLEAQ